MKSIQQTLFITKKKLNIFFFNNEEVQLSSELLFYGNISLGLISVFLNTII